MTKAMKVGDWVVVRSAVEILRTLDENGQLDGMPFMPEMLRFCDRKFQVYRRAHKTCDSTARRSRRLKATVHLDIRCSGEAHGGCQAGCLLFWKTAWLRRCEGETATGKHSGQSSEGEVQIIGTREEVALSPHTFRRQQDGTLRYICQATQIRAASTPLRWWDISQYVEDLRSGNVKLARLIGWAVGAAFFALGRTRTGGFVRWFFDRFHMLWGGLPFPQRTGSIPQGQRTPLTVLNLMPGELVRVRPLKDIERTLDTAGRNRGLYFDSEMVPYVNQPFRVLRRVERIIDEETGKMMELKTPSIVLQSTVCQGRYSPCRMFCPKSTYVLWREAWLDRELPLTNQDAL